MRTLPAVDVFHQPLVAPFHHAFLQLASAVVVCKGNTLVDCNEAAMAFWHATDKASLLKQEGAQLVFTTKSAHAFFLNLVNTCIQSDSHKAEVLTQTFDGEILHAEVSLLAWNTKGQEPLIYTIWTPLSPAKGAYTLQPNHAQKAWEGTGAIKTPEQKGVKVSHTNIGLTADRYGVVELDIKSRVIVFEKKICEFIGIFNTNISDTSFVISSQDFVDKYVCEEDKPRVLAKLHSLNMYSGSTASSRNRLEFTLLNDLEQIRKVRILFKPVIDEDGNLKKCHGVLQDYTEQDYFQDKVNRYKSSLEILVKKRTQQLTRSQANLSDALDFAHLSIWEFDTKYQVFKVSGKMFQNKELEGQGLRDRILSIPEAEELLVQDDWLAFKDRIDYLMAEAAYGHTEYLEIRTKPYNKRFRHYHLNAKCTVDDHGVRKIYGTIQDITQIKRTQDENVRLIEMVEASNDIIIVANKEIEVEYINKAGKAFIESAKTQADQLVQDDKFAEILHSVKGGVITAMKNGTWNGETTITRYDGYKVPFSVQVIAHTSSSQIKFISAVFRDLIKQKKTEEDLLKKNKDLDTFLYRTSHDFRAPITTLIGLGKLAKMEVKDQTALQYIGMFEEQFGRLHKLNINISRLIGINETSVFEGDKIQVDSQTIVEKVIKELGLRYDISQVRFDTALCQKIEYWPKAIEMLSLALFNLVENAIQFKKDDTAPLVQIKIESVSHYKSLMVEVTDNGVGIPSEVNPRIFEMFYRGHADSKGFGLGLFKVKKIVEKLNGSIQVNSTLGEGSSFILQLPLTIDPIQ